jgi:hypothetical protein
MRKGRKKKENFRKRDFKGGKIVCKKKKEMDKKKRKEKRKKVIHLSKSFGAGKVYFGHLVLLP